MYYEKFNSVLYDKKKPFHKMSMRELCDYNKIVSELDKMSLKKIKRIEKWSDEKIDQKIKKFLNKNKDAKTKKNKKYKHLKKRTKRRTKKLKLNKQYFTLHLIE